MHFKTIQHISLLLRVNIVFYVSHFKRLTNIALYTLYLWELKGHMTSWWLHSVWAKRKQSQIPPWWVEQIKRLKHGILVHSSFKVHEALPWVNSSFCWGVELDVMDLQPGFKPSTGYVVIIAWWMVVEQRGVDTINWVGNQLHYEM